MSKIKDEAIVGFWALGVSALTPELVRNLESLLSNLPGVEQFEISLEAREMIIQFDQNQLDFQTLVAEMAGVGCYLRDISVALIL